ncbi:DUF4003 family protein [Lysinibacillus telephonicus]|uniref:DUF4003 family protein n=1 Tax=Lysinibacillus telephonicus TaxID=1714840 RepID=UPI0031FDE369
MSLIFLNDSNFKLNEGSVNSMENKAYIELLNKNYEKLVNYLSWTIDKRIMLMLASHYSAEGKTFSFGSFEAVIEEIKRQTSWLSTLRSSSNLLYSVAMLLDGKEEPHQAVKNLIESEEILKQAKFKRSAYSYISAIFLTKHSEQKQAHAHKARKLYDAIRKHHPFLTSHEDMPYSVLLSNNDEDPELRAQTMNRYYTELRKNNFALGNHSQWLSQVLTLNSSVYVEQLVPYVVQIRNELVQRKVNLKKEHYPLIGFLAVAGAKTENINQIVALYEELTKVKLFRWYKSIAFSIALQKVLHDLANLSDSLDMSIITNLEMLIQAEQAITATTTIAVVADSTSTSSD